MKKFLLNILLILSPFAILIAVVNFTVDPANVFSNGSYEKKVGDILLKGHNIDNLKNFDDRLALKNLITQLPYKPDIVSIGSSRSLQMSSSFFPGKKFINCSLSHANLNDFIAVIGMLESANKLPSEMYIETLISYSDIEELLSVYKYYLHGLDVMNIKQIEDINIPLHIFKKKITALFSFAYFQNCLPRLLHRHQNRFNDVDTTIPKNFGRLYDFSITYPKEYQTRDTLKAIADAEIFAAKSSVPRITASDLMVLKQILGYLKTKGVKVTLVNLPFQLDCYRLFNEKSKQFGDLANAVKNFAIEMKLPLIGTFNPNEANLNRRNFWDQIHCDKAALKTVMKIVQYNPD